MEEKKTPLTDYFSDYKESKKIIAHYNSFSIDELANLPQKEINKYVLHLLKTGTQNRLRNISNIRSIDIFYTENNESILSLGIKKDSLLIFNLFLHSGKFDETFKINDVSEFESEIDRTKIINTYDLFAFCIYSNSKKIIRTLIDMKFDLNKTLTYNGEVIIYDYQKDPKNPKVITVDTITNPLLYSISLDRYSIIKTFLSSGADPNKTDANGMTILHHAVKKHKSKIVKILLEGGADPNIQDVYGNTPMHYMYEAFDETLESSIGEGINRKIKKYDIYTSLLKYGADRLIKNKKGLKAHNTWNESLIDLLEKNYKHDESIMFLKERLEEKHKNNEDVSFVVSSICVKLFGKKASELFY